MVIRKRLAGTHLKGLVPRIAEGWPPRRLFNKALLAFACLNLILLLGSCYTARWFESDNSIASSKYLNVLVLSYEIEAFASTGAWGDGGRKWVLNPCPWDPEHTNRSAYIVQLATGPIGAGCHHSGCADRTWADLRPTGAPHAGAYRWRRGHPVLPVIEVGP